MSTALVVLVRAAVRDSQRTVHPVALVFVGLAAYSALQALPLPLGLVARLSPSAADIWSRALLPVGKTLSWGSISLDPKASLVSASQWATVAAAFQFGVLGGRVGRARRMFRMVFFCGGVLALVSVAHQLVGAHKVFGIYEPHSDFKAHGVGPLLNPNHLAGYLSFAALLGLGQVLEPRAPMPRALVAAVVVACIGVGLRTASLGGAAALALGLVVFFAILIVRWWTRGDRAGFSMGTAAATAVALAGAGITLAWFGWDRRMFSELSTVNAGKARMISWSWPLVDDYVRTGVGRGAFESAFESYRPIVGTNVSFTHPENFILQWVAEWGFVGLVALVALAWLLRPRRAHFRTPANVGATAAAVALLAQNLADFSLELAGPAIALAVVLGALAGQSPRRRDDASSKRTGVGWRRGAPWVVPAGALAFGVVALIFGAPDLTDARANLRDVVVAANDSSAAADAQSKLEAAMRSRPADYYFPMLGAQLAENTGADPTPWVQRALERGPSIGRIHLLLARILARRHATGQAMLELRTAAEMELPLRTTTGEMAPHWSSDIDMLTRAVPDAPEGIDVFNAMSLTVLARGDKILAAKLDARALEQFPDAVPTRMRVVQRLREEIASKTCESEDACIAELAMHGTFLVDRYPDSAQGDIVLAQASVARGDTKTAREDLRAACKKPHYKLECLQELAVLEEPSALGNLVDRYLALGCANPTSCAGAYDWASGVYASKDLWAQAYGAAEHAARTAPTKDRWARASSFASRAGLTSEQSTAEREGARLQK